MTNNLGLMEVSHYSKENAGAIIETSSHRVAVVCGIHRIAAKMTKTAIVIKL